MSQEKKISPQTSFTDDKLNNAKTADDFIYVLTGTVILFKTSCFAKSEKFSTYNNELCKVLDSFCLLLNKGGSHKVSEIRHKQFNETIIQLETIVNILYQTGLAYRSNEIPNLLDKMIALVEFIEKTPNIIFSANPNLNIEKSHIETTLLSLHFLITKIYLQFEKRLNEVEDHLNKASDLLPKIINRKEYVISLIHFHSQKAIFCIKKDDLANANKNIAIADKLSGRFRKKTGFNESILGEAYQKLALSCLKNKNNVQAIFFYESANEIWNDRIKVFKNPNKEITKYFFPIVLDDERLNKLIHEAKKKIEENTIMITQISKKLFQERSIMFNLEVETSNTKIILREIENFCIEIKPFEETNIIFIEAILKKFRITYMRSNAVININLIEFPMNLLSLLINQINGKINNINTKESQMYSNTKMELQEPIQAKFETTNNKFELLPDEKTEKLKRHEAANELKLLATGQTAPQIEDKHDLKSNIISQKLTWKESPPNGVTLYPIYGKKRATFIFFKDDLFSTVPLVVEEKCKMIANSGKILGSENSKNRQGIVFFKKDKKIKQHDERYKCKIKIFGSQGTSNIRPIARKFTEGFLTEVNNEKAITTAADLYIFDTIIQSAHKSNK